MYLSREGPSIRFLAVLYEPSSHGCGPTCFEKTQSHSGHGGLTPWSSWEKTLNWQLPRKSCLWWPTGEDERYSIIFLTISLCFIFLKNQSRKTNQMPFPSFYWTSFIIVPSLSYTRNVNVVESVYIFKSYQIGPKDEIPITIKSAGPSKRYKQ